METNRKPWIRRILIGIATILAAAFVGAWALLNPVLTRYVESPGFRDMLEKETAKGLHFPGFTFGPIRRTGFLTATSAHATARDGWKAMTTLEAREITARFNPAGVLLRRWQIDDLHIERGEVGIHIYEPRPEAIPAKPWYALFLPDRVYLNHTWTDHADITWPMRGEKAGIFDTKLVITPHGRDFNYAATGGVLHHPPLPELPLQQTHLLITKELFRLYDLDVGSDKLGTVHAEGNAATRGDKNLNFKFDWKDLPLSEWLPEKWKGNLKGAADGGLTWKGPDYKLRDATFDGEVWVKEGKVLGVGFLDQIAQLTGKPDLRTLQLTKCSTKFAWQNSECRISDLEVEEKGKFRIEGTVTFSEKLLGGKLELGMARSYLDWLPHPEEVFPRESGGYLWTTIHLSGTLNHPQQDLSPRIIEAFKESPGAILGLALRQLGTWLHGD